MSTHLANTRTYMYAYVFIICKLFHSQAVSCSSSVCEQMAIRSAHTSVVFTSSYLVRVDRIE